MSTWPHYRIYSLDARYEPEFSILNEDVGQ